MDKISLTPVTSEAQYEGRFTDFRFALLANPIPVYQSLLKHLAGDGATLDSLKLEATTLSTANISCSLVSLNTTVKVLIDRFEVSFLRLHEIGEQRAVSVLLKSWGALKEIDPSLVLAEHVVLTTVCGLIKDVRYDTLMQRYVAAASVLGDNTKAGVVFYLPEDEAIGQRAGSIVLDRLGTHEQAVILKLNTGFSAKQVPLEALPQRFDEYVTNNLDRLGIMLNREDIQ
ncbi:MAG: hypothetical protein ACE5JQ_07985 [Candidatus Methylomirabilales bacterium]